MGDVKKIKGIPQDVSGKDYGPTFDPFAYGFVTRPSYKGKGSDDKYVTSGSYNEETNELDLNVNGSDTVKIKLEGVSGRDEKVTGGTSEITEDKQILTLDIASKEGEIAQQVSIDLSGIGDTYYSKTQIDEKLMWGEF